MRQGLHALEAGLGLRELMGLRVGFQPEVKVEMPRVEILVGLGRNQLRREEGWADRPDEKEIAKMYFEEESIGKLMV